MSQLQGLLQNVIPNNFSSLFLSISGIFSGICLRVLPFITVSHVLVRFKLMRFTIDHCFMLSTSSGAGSGQFAWIGILKIIPSANLISRFLLGYTAVSP